MFKKKTKKESESTLLITNPNQKNSRVDYNEIYRHIRTNIEYSAVGQDIKVINITSAAPSESKSTTSLNLAMIYAAKYPKVLLIDAEDVYKRQLLASFQNEWSFFRLYFIFFHLWNQFIA